MAERKPATPVCALTTHFSLGPVDAFDVRPAEGVLAETRTTSLELGDVTARSFHDINEVSLCLLWRNGSRRRGQACESVAQKSRTNTKSGRKVTNIVILVHRSKAA